MKPKNKVVSFRLSAEDYDQLRQVGIAHGVNTLSEMARVAMNRMLETQEPSGLPEHVREPSIRVESLSSEFTGMSQAGKVKQAHCSRSRPGELRVVNNTWRWDK